MRPARTIPAPNTRWAYSARVRCGVIPHGVNQDGDTQLHLAAEWGDAKVFKLLLGVGADPNSKNKYGGAPLHRAAWRGYSDGLRQLLAAGADLHSKNNYGETALHAAAFKGRRKVVELLLQHGAMVYVQDNKGNSPGDTARVRGYTDILELLPGGAGNCRGRGGWRQLSRRPCQATALQPLSLLYCCHNAISKNDSCAVGLVDDQCPPASWRHPEQAWARGQYLAPYGCSARRCRGVQAAAGSRCCSGH